MDILWQLVQLILAAVAVLGLVIVAAWGLLDLPVTWRGP